MRSDWLVSDCVRFQFSFSTFSDTGGKAFGSRLVPVRRCGFICGSTKTPFPFPGGLLTPAKTATLLE